MKGVELVDKIMDTLQEYEISYDDSLEFYYEIKEKLEKYYELVAHSELIGKDLICDYISEYINDLEGKIRIEELTG